MNLECPLPVDVTDTVTLGHGSGGELSQRLLRQYVFPHLNVPGPARDQDAATLPLGDARLAFTTDSFVITPLFFPGGDIGKLAVYGTVNDLAMAGARPLYMSCSLILEEGLSLATLGHLMASMGKAARETGVQLVTGDTKVVERGKGDGLYINTAGVGAVPQEVEMGPQCIQQGDLIILSGDVGRHGMAVMAKREGLEFESPLTSDCAPLHEAVKALLEGGIPVHCLRDLTRGGLATALVELARAAAKTLAVREQDIAVNDAVLGACELLGLDPLYVANEGRFIAFVPPQYEQAALQVLARHTVSSESRLIGRVAPGDRALVTMQNSLGCERLLDLLPGEQLPRIC